MSYRVSIDIGGTFTDLVVVDEKGEIGIFKSLTTPANYVDAVIDDLKQASQHIGLPLAEFMEKCSSSVGGSLVHGSTIGTNAMVEGKVPRTGLLCTRGFRDILTVREGGRKDPYDWDLDFPEPYIPRYLTLPVTERMNAEGEVEAPLNEGEVREAIQQFKVWNVRAIAVSLLWSIANPTHELRIGEILQEEWTEIPYVLGHQVNPCIREYRRTSSAAINASLKPIISTYISSFEKRLKELGYQGEMLMLTSSGGVMSVEELMTRPIYSVDSGPALAPTAGLWFSTRECGKEDCIVVDMGGTSFDISCVSQGKIVLSREAWVGEHLLGISKVDTESIGAGGGSIAWIDPGGLIHVGPQSSGAVPGPACYGRGGVDPTVTDANVVLGYIDPEYFLGGAMPLNRKSAERIIREKVGEPLHLGLEEAAFSIWSTTNINMTSAIEDITVRQGIDPREYLFVAGGGAAGLHIVPIVKELGATEVLIPKTAATISSIGGVFADIVVDFSAMRYTDSRRFDYKGVNEDLANLERDAIGFLARAGVPEGQRRIEFYVEARYGFQVWELPVPLRSKRVDDENALARLVEDFHEAHERVFAVRDPDQYVEFVYWRAQAIGERRKPAIREVPSGGEDASGALRGRRRAYFKTLGGMVETPIYRADGLLAGNSIAGPAIIEEPMTTIVVFPGSSASVTKLGSYFLEMN